MPAKTAKIPTKVTKIPTKVTKAPTHEHILMPAKRMPYYFCCVRRGCLYTEYWPQVVGGRRQRVLSQYEERHDVSRRREPAIIIEQVSIWQWAEGPMVESGESHE